MKNLLRDVKISTRVFALVGLTALLMGSVIGLGLRQINAIGKEVATITEEDIPLLRVLNRITFNGLEQSIHLERAIQLGKHMAQDNAAKENFEIERNNFLGHGQKITQEIEDGRKLVEQMCENYNTSGTEDMLLSIDYALRSISKERADFQFLAERVFNLLSQDKLEQAESAIQKIARGYKTEEEIRQEELLENLSLGIEKFIGYSVVEARRSKQNAVVGMLSYSVLVLLFSLALGIFISRTVTKPLSIAVNVAHQIAAGDRNVEIKAISKDETGRLLAAMKKMSCAIEKSEENLKATNQQLQASEQQLNAANQQLTAGEQHLKASNQQLRANEEQLRALNHNLNERSKELDCLYRVSRLATESDKTTNEFFEGVVGLIPSSWQYPEITCARIAVNGQEFMTDNFEQTIWKQSADIVASGEKIGFVEVYYLQDKPVIDEGPFLKEERHLIDALSRQLGIIFERKKAEKKLERLNENLEDAVAKLGRANSELKDFVYIASHDLREPMRKISSFGELLSASLKDKLNDDEKENLGFMVDGAKRMQQMIEALLVYSRVTTRGVDFEPVDLNKVVEELRDVELAVKIEEIGAKIMTPERLHSVNCAPAQIGQLMQNLIANGLKYHKKDVVPEITIRSSVADNDMIRVEVSDNGIGIKEEQFENVFVMFKRLHSRQEYEGTGIGLAVCKKIVECHGGDIGVSSAYGQGATFWFTLPALKTPVEKQSETSVALRV